MNQLFSEYAGPVLIAQGALDPLNDAVARAKAFAAIRDDVAVELLQLGHCPMDEGAPQVASCIMQWAAVKNITAKTLQ